MIRKIFISIAVTFVLSTISVAQTEFTTWLYDFIRNRPIPIAVYQPKHTTKHTKVIIFNHGYDGNQNNESNKTYSYLTEPLSQEGYYVISIQHELPDDPLLAMEGNFMETRMPNWKRGVENILFTIQEFKKLKPELDWNNLIMIGHSNGGDMTMLFATQYPEMITKAISMDHRRMIMPKTEHPRIYTLRGSDYEADKGIIPTATEQKTYHITVIQLNGINHSDMDNKGKENQHKVILNHINNFLNQ
ncbi:alpha/beta hydrolase [Phocaeicola sp.]